MWPQKLSYSSGMHVTLIIPFVVDLVKRRIAMSNVCPVCSTREETVLNGLWSCSKAQLLWKHMDFSSALRRGVYVSFSELYCWALIVFNTL